MKTKLTLLSLSLCGMVSAQNFIINGDFESGSTGFSSQYTAICTSLATWFPDNPVINEKNYCVCDSTGNFTGFAGWQNCKDHTPGSGKKMMVINGSTDANVSIWCEHISGIKPGTNYKFSTYITSIITNNPAKLQFSINGNLLGSAFNATSNTCDWNQFYEIWNSGTATSADICIVNQNTISNGNDFALDDISFIETGLVMPNVFTPNGDGMNETFHPITYKEIDGFNFKIYDRWGRLMYENKDATGAIEPEWNGKMGGDGSDAVAGTYFWVLDYYTVIEAKTLTETLTGTATLIR